MKYILCLAFLVAAVSAGGYGPAVVPVIPKVVKVVHTPVLAHVPVQPVLVRHGRSVYGAPIVAPIPVHRAVVTAPILGVAAVGHGLGLGHAPLPHAG